MNNENLDEYQLFYQEVPEPDYLNDIEIQDEHEDLNYEDVHGLSDEQVSQLARDSLTQEKIRKKLIGSETQPELVADSGQLDT